MHTCKIATKLSELRTAKGFTQDEVASALSVSNKTISKWENGTSFKNRIHLMKNQDCMIDRYS